MKRLPLVSGNTENTRARLVSLREGAAPRGVALTSRGAQVGRRVSSSSCPRNTRTPFAPHVNVYVPGFRSCSSEPVASNECRKFFKTSSGSFVSSLAVSSPREPV